MMRHSCVYEQSCDCGHRGSFDSSTSNQTISPTMDNVSDLLQLWCTQSYGWRIIKTGNMTCLCVLLSNLVFWRMTWWNYLEGARRFLFVKWYAETRIVIRPRVRVIDNVRLSEWSKLLKRICTGGIQILTVFKVPSTVFSSVEWEIQPPSCVGALHSVEIYFTRIVEYYYLLWNAKITVSEHV